MEFAVLADAAPRLLGLLVLLVFSAFFSGSETSLFSLSRGQRERLAHSERGSERAVARLLSNPRRLIVTLLVGNELVNITFSSLASGLVASVVPGWGRTAVVLLATTVTVLALLMFGEIAPKSIAIRAPETWARGTARPILLFAMLMTPVRVLFNAIASLVMRLLGSQGVAPSATAIGEDEFKALVDAGSAEGTLDATERSLIHRVFEFGDRRVNSIMRSAHKVFSLSYELPLARLLEEITRHSFSRVPIYERRRDEIIGVLYAKDLIGLGTGRFRGRTVKDLLRTPFFVPKTTKCVDLFREFKRSKTHLALVVDEYGRLAGLVTMEDLLEELFGEIRDEKESPLRRQSTAGGESTAKTPGASS